MKYDKSLLLNPKSRKGTRIKFADHPEFQPNLTPRQVLQEGSFGGTYWREIDSSVVKKRLKDQHKIDIFDGWWKGIPDNHMTRPFEQYDISVNKFKKRVGTTLEFWEEKRWIKKHDPYGWFQWYCHFYAGRRIEGEDERQIKRWKGVAGKNGRFRKRLANMIREKQAHYNDKTISPGIRQTLQHWGYMVTKNV